MVVEFLKFVIFLSCYQCYVKDKDLTMFPSVPFLMYQLNAVNGLRHQTNSKGGTHTIYSVKSWLAFGLSALYSASLVIPVACVMSLIPRALAATPSA